MVLSICLFHLVLSYGPTAKNGAQAAVQVIRKDEGDLTPPRSTPTKRETIRPSSSPGINTVPDDGSCIAQEPRTG
jgi:hypothetical protein